MKIPYDDDAFFAQYAQMNRSRQGLEGAGEWHQLEPLFPPLNGSRVLDPGCGYGWHCAYAAQNGAVEVLGIDSSKKMIAEARRRNGGAGISYRVCALDDYEYPESRWDLVVSNLVLHYIADLEGVYRAVAQTASAGRRVFVQHRTPGIHRRSRPGLGIRSGRATFVLAGRRLLQNRRARNALSGLRGRQTAPHADRNFDGSFAQRLCHRACRRGPAPRSPGWNSPA